MRMSTHPSTSCLLLHCIVLLYLCVCVCANDMPVQMKSNSHVEKKSVFYKLRTKKNPCKLMTPSDSSKKKMT